MIVSDRLREQMKRCDVSQSELARRIGVSQQAISRLVAGAVVGSKNLHRIARELGTTPAYLTGETDDPDADAPPEPTLNREDRALFDAFHQLEAVERAALLQVVQLMASRGSAPGRRRQDVEA